MTDVNIKKLIASFLGIAIIASLLILVIPSIIPLIYSPSGSNLTILNQAPTATSASNQAFAPSSSSLPDFYNQTAVPIQDGTQENLTQVFAQQLAQQIVTKNPGGPVNLTDSSSVLIPASDQIISQFNNYVQQNNALVIPPPSYQYTVIDKPTPKQNGDYLTSVKNILAQTVLSDTFKNYSSQTITPDNFVNNFSSISLVLDQAIQQLAIIPVPKPLLPVHQSLVKYLSDQKEIYNQVADYQNDPARAAIVLQASDLVKDLITKDQESVQAEFSKIQFVSQKVSEATQKNTLSDLIGNLLGIDKARAAAFSLVTGSSLDAGITSQVTAGAASDAASKLAITVPSTLVADTSFLSIQQTEQTTKNTIWQTYIEPILTNILQIIVQTLIHQIVVQTINWINNGYQGQPFYVQNWQTFLSNAADQAGGAVANTLIPGACQPFQAALQISQLPVNPAQTTNCTLSDIVGNFQNFANNFSAGGWLAYGASLDPQNNFLGASLLIQDQVQNAKVQAAANAAQEAVAGKGFQPAKICVERLDRSYGWVSTTTTNADQLSPTDPDCTKTQTVTPGEAIANLSDRTLGSDIDQWVNAKDISALVNALVNSAISNLIQAGTKGLKGTTFKYTQPTPLFQQLSTPTTATAEFDVNTLNQDTAMVQNWLSAKSISAGLLPAIPAEIKSFEDNINSYVTQISAYTLDVSPDTCVAKVIDPFFESDINSLNSYSNKSVSQLESIVNAEGDLQVNLNELQFLQYYTVYPTANTSTEPLQPLINVVNNQIGLINASTSDVISFQKALSNAISAIGAYNQPLTFSYSGPDSGIISAKTAMASFIAADPALAAKIDVSQIADGAKNIQDGIVDIALNDAINSTSTGLQAIANQIIPVAARTNAAAAASSTINAAIGQLQSIQNNLGSIGPTFDNIQTFNFNNNTGNDLVSYAASTTQIESVLGFNIANLGLDQDTLNQLGLSNIASFIASSTLTQTLAGSTSDYNTAANANPPDTNGETLAAQNLYGALTNEINNLLSVLNTAQNQNQNVTALTGYQSIPQLAMNANNILTNLAQTLTFNQLVQAIFGQASKYSDADTELSGIAGVNCGLRKENSNQQGSISQQLQDAVNQINSGHTKFIPQVCGTIIGQGVNGSSCIASSNSQVNDTDDKITTTDVLKGAALTQELSASENLVEIAGNPAGDIAALLSGISASASADHNLGETCKIYSTAPTSQSFGILFHLNNGYTTNGDITSGDYGARSGYKNVYAITANRPSGFDIAWKPEDGSWIKSFENIDFSDFAYNNQLNHAVSIQEYLTSLTLPSTGGNQSSGLPNISCSQ